MNIKALPIILATAFFFGSSLISSRFGIGQFSSLTFVQFRIGIAAILFLLVYLFDHKKRPFPRSKTLWKHGLVLSLTAAAIPMLSFVTALNYLSSGVTSILNTSGPAVTVIMAHFLLQSEALTKRKIVGVGVALSGTLLLALLGENGLGDAGKANPIGYLLLLIGILCVSGSTIYVRKYAQTMNAFDLTSSQIIIAALLLMPVTAVSGGVQMSGVTWQGVFALIYGAVIGTVAAFWLFFYAVRRFGAIAGAMVPLTVPLIATVGGVIVLNEQITMGTVFGMLIIITGIAVINSDKIGIDDSTQ